MWSLTVSVGGNINEPEVRGFRGHQAQTVIPRGHPCQSEDGTTPSEGVHLERREKRGGWVSVKTLKVNSGTVTTLASYF